MVILFILKEYILMFVWLFIILLNDYVFFDECGYAIEVKDVVREFLRNGVSFGIFSFVVRNKVGM